MTVGPAEYFYNSADGLRLYCGLYAAKLSGGIPVLCLPGLTRNSRDFGSLAAHLTERHEVLAADLRGRGHSAWDPDPTHYQLPTYVHWVPGRRNPSPSTIDSGSSSPEPATATASSILRILSSVAFAGRKM
jgi:pimeloyl-ACP methyl ester carboxylesterase